MQDFCDAHVKVLGGTASHHTHNTHATLEHCNTACCMLFQVAAYFTAPDFTDGSDAKNFLGGLYKTGLSLFGLHTILILLRIKFTIARWQTLLTCEFFKTAFIVHVAYGLTKIEFTKFDSQGQLIS